MSFSRCSPSMPRAAVAVPSLAIMMSVLVPASAATAQVAPPALARVPNATDEGWPRQYASAEGTILFYQPQIDVWDGAQFQAHSAVAIDRASASQVPLYGVIWISCRTEVDKETDRKSTR